MHGLMSYRRFGRARSLRSDRAERTLGRCVATELRLGLGRYVATELRLELSRYVETERIRTKLYLGNIRCDVLLTEHDLLRKDILVFCGDLDVNFVATVFDPNRVDRSFVLDLVDTHETPETVREGYYGAYLSFFHTCGLIFPIPEPILEVLAEIGLSLTQLLPNFLRHLVAFLVKARQEGLSFGFSEFRQLVLVKQSKQNPGTFLVSPCPGRHVIEDIPYRDEKWREQFFVFKIDRASMGDFDFSQLPRRWAENIG
ncbi:hypothetical protein F2Q70_00035233 [Brassica cretica]|uniref:Uncharacterized protein n=1 Tax=Brassica cretica TaxID=69181 RepID=A0A8S9JZA7_BRACR|nr:hypothetical protein F2Q70_00035233 [Brassica cretica]